MKRATEFMLAKLQFQPSASRTTDLYSGLIPPMNRWATINRPLRGLVLSGF